MNHLEQAIRDAVEKGGSELRDYDGDPMNIEDLDLEMEPHVIASDRSFWIALGKARGWTPQGGTGRSYHDEYGAGGYPSMYDWQIKWHRLIDHLANGADIESFFATL